MQLAYILQGAGQPTRDPVLLQSGLASRFDQAFMPGVSGLRNLAPGGRPAVPAWNYGPHGKTHAALPIGRAAMVVNAPGSAAALGVAPIVAHGAYPICTLFVGDFNGASDNWSPGGYYVGTANGQDIFGIRLQSGTIIEASIRNNFGTLVSLSATVTGLSSRAPVVGMLLSRSATDHVFVVNGGTPSTSASSVGDLTARTHFIVGGYSNGTPNAITKAHNGALSLVMGSRQSFSNEEMVWLTTGNNIWSLFGERIFFPTTASGPASYSLVAAAGSYSLSGQAALLKAARKVVAAAGSYSLTGNAAGIYRGLRLVAGAGSFAWSGQAANVRAQRKLVAAAGTYALTGNAAVLRLGRMLAMASGSYSFTGQAIGLTKTGSSSLAANAGSFTLSGQSASLRANRRLLAQAGIFNLTGSVANLLKGYRLAATVQTYALTGQAATLSYSGASPSVSYTSRTRLFVTGRELRVVGTQRILRSIRP